jgi:hypothetical protein
MAMLLSIPHLDREVSQEPAMAGKEAADADAVDTLLDLQPGQIPCHYGLYIKAFSR